MDRNDTLQLQRANSPLGEVWFLREERGARALLLGEDAEHLEAELRRRHPRAHWRDTPPADELAAILAYLRGERVDLQGLPLALRGTPFQERVWAALRRIPYGETCSYQKLAEELGNASAARAVGTACARNPVALLIPCHRVLRQDGKLGGYAWGLGVKAALLRLEAREQNKTRRQLPLV